MRRRRRLCWSMHRRSSMLRRCQTYNWHARQGESSHNFWFFFSKILILLRLCVTYISNWKLCDIRTNCVTRLLTGMLTDVSISHALLYFYFQFVILNNSSVFVNLLHFCLFLRNNCHKKLFFFQKSTKAENCRLKHLLASCVTDVSTENNLD